MIKFWTYISSLSIILLFSCEDIPEITFNQVPITINLSATSSDFEQLSLDFQQVKINNELNEIDTISAVHAGIYDMTKWVTEKKLIGEFVVSYDSIQQIEIYLGDDNTLIDEGYNFDLLITSNQSSFIIPVRTYIQDLEALELHVELDVAQSIIYANGQYEFNPKFVLKN